jgi:hypothetical protein
VDTEGSGVLFKEVPTNHEYDENVTAQGYRVDNCTGIKYGLAEVWARTEGTEYCDLGSGDDWDKSGYSPDGGQPWTLDGYGGYASSGCRLGHWFTTQAEVGINDSIAGLSFTFNNGWVGQYHGGSLPNDYQCVLLFDPVPDDPTPPCDSNFVPNGFPPLVD